jgi:2-polyprenyl-3-methyl-5-hydroxy-6-metoxy-1,4-benzoquinol methylase
MKISNGFAEQGIVVGNTYDKYGSSNPIVRRIMRGFDTALTELVGRAAPSSIHEIGCGEGYWVLRWIERGLSASGSDFSSHIIDVARDNAIARKISPDVFSQQDIYDIRASQVGADLIVCCEVLEHLEKPNEALRIIRSLGARYVIVSVPREPIWSVMNLARGKYISDLGNTPGHIQRWSQRAFLKLVAKHFDIIELRAPIPWTMMLCASRGSAAR